MDDASDSGPNGDGHGASPADSSSGSTSGSASTPARAAALPLAAPPPGEAPFLMPFAACTSPAPAPGAALPPATRPLPTHVGVRVPAALAAHLAAAGSGLRAVISAGDGGPPLADTLLAPPAAMPALAAAAAAAGGGDGARPAAAAAEAALQHQHVHFSLQLPPLRVLLPISPSRLLVLLLWRPPAGGFASLRGGGEDGETAGGGGGAADARSSSGSNSGATGLGLEEGDGADHGTLLASLPLLLLPSPGCCVEALGLLPAALAAAGADGGGEGGGEGGALSEGEAFGRWVAPLLHDLAQALAGRPRLAAPPPPGGGGAPLAGAALEAYAQDVGRLLAFLLSSSMPLCAGELLAAAERAGVGIDNRQLFGVGAGAGPAVAAALAAAEQWPPPAAAPRSPYETPPAAPLPAAPPRLSWLPRGGASSGGSGGEPAAAAAFSAAVAAAELLGLPPPAPASPPSPTDEGGPSTSAAAAPAPARSPAPALPPPPAGGRAALLRACAFSFPDAEDEADYAAFKAGRVAHLPPLLVAFEAAAFLTLCGREAARGGAPAPWPAPPACLAALAAYVLLSCLPLLARLAGARLGWRGWRRVAERHEAIVVAVQVLETAAVTTSLLATERPQLLRDFVTAAGARPSMVKAGALQLSSKNSLLCTLIRAAEHLLAISTVASKGGRVAAAAAPPLRLPSPGADGAAAAAIGSARAGTLAALFVTSALGTAVAVAGDYATRTAWLRERGATARAEEQPTSAAAGGGGGSIGGGAAGGGARLKGE
ncbi:MAG: hypothetical protein J3K34DRAFT_503421 [Monoraphidium minutum]|nr:MAG: hypothetical protein J3K34DRAFT_503421 [Monoraphidium minutum]